MPKFKVKLRRNELFQVKPHADQIDSKVFEFNEGWVIDDSKLYNGETALIPNDANYPLDAPTWVASGDLELVKNGEN